MRRLGGKREDHRDLFARVRSETEYLRGFAWFDALMANCLGVQPPSRGKTTL